MTTDWIRHLAADIADRFNRPQAERMLEDVIREAVRANTPDVAPDLLDALEELIAELDARTPPQGSIYTDTGGMELARAALAAHPAQVSTETVLGNK